jgi:hypothetical protein
LRAFSSSRSRSESFSFQPVERPGEASESGKSGHPQIFGHAGYRNFGPTEKAVVAIKKE